MRTCSFRGRKIAGLEKLNARAGAVVISPTHCPLRVDVDGNLCCGWGGSAGNDGVMIFNTGGKLIGRIDLPERCANVCFGGFRRSRLFMAASHCVYALFLRTQGAPGG